MFSTVHGFCLRLLRENAIRAGVDPQVAILPEAQSALLQQKSLTRALDELLAEQPEAMTRLMRSLSAPEIDLIGVYDALRSSGISVEELRDYPARPCEASVDQIHAFVASVRNAVGNTALRRSTINELLDWGAGLQDCRGAGEFLAHYSGFKISPFGRDAGGEERGPRYSRADRDPAPGDYHGRAPAAAFHIDRHTRAV